jgi:hypothetical protein
MLREKRAGNLRREGLTCSDTLYQWSHLRESIEKYSVLVVGFRLITAPKSVPVLLATPSVSVYRSYTYP